MRTERMYQHRSAACKGRGSGAAPGRLVHEAKPSVLETRPMPRTKKSIKNRSKTKKQALKRKRARRNKGLKRGMRAR